MSKDNKNKNKTRKKDGFTLVEMLVSIAIFAIILTVILGTIVTIVDVNRKARILSEIMNNLSFSLESITRSVKTGVDTDVSANILETTDQEGKTVKYKLNSTNGQIEKCRKSGNCSSGDYAPITSSDVFIEKLVFEETNFANQPRILITVSGIARAARDVSTTFKIQTTVSQRNLEI